MAYVTIYPKWLPYAKMNDTRGFISRRFGMDGHSGVDSVGNQYGNQICAAINGKVTAVYTSTTLGNVVEYGSGGVRLAHYHLSAVLVRVGDPVSAGETMLGVEGATGSLATGKHLHTSLWLDGTLSDPEPYLCGQRPWPQQNQKEEVLMQHQIGEQVKVNGRIYSSAWSAEPSISGGGKTYTITSIIQLKNVSKPYQLGRTGFCSEEDLAAGEGADTGALRTENEQLKQQLEAANRKLDAVREAVNG